VEDNYAPKGITRESMEFTPISRQEKGWQFSFCADLRNVNAVTRKDGFPTPLVSDTLDALIGNK